MAGNPTAEIHRVLKIVGLYRKQKRDPRWVYFESKRQNALAGYHALKNSGRLPRECVEFSPKKGKERKEGAGPKRERRATERDFGALDEIKERWIADLIIGKPIPELGFELLPLPCHGQNIRVLLTRADWEKLRRLTFRRNNYRCQLCRISAEETSLHCHENWFFDDNSRRQVLKGLIALCEECHDLIHMDFAESRGDLQAALADYAGRINWKYSEVEEYYLRQLELRDLRSRHDWILDVSLIARIGLRLPDEVMQKGVRLRENLRKKPLTAA